MNKQFELGDKVELLEDIKNERGDGIHIANKGTIGYVCDAEYPDLVSIDAKNANGEDDYFDVYNKQIKLLEKSNLK